MGAGIISSTSAVIRKDGCDRIDYALGNVA